MSTCRHQEIGDANVTGNGQCSSAVRPASNDLVAEMGKSEARLLKKEQSKLESFSVGDRIRYQTHNLGSGQHVQLSSNSKDEI